MSTKNIGTVVQVTGPVLDIRFPEENLPNLLNAITLEHNGQTITAAIGQSYSLFTPLQLANYVATLAGGGTRYNAHLLKEVRTYDSAELVDVYDEPPAEIIDIEPENLQAVLQGMRDLVVSGSVAYYFKDCVVDAAAKTGTAQITAPSEGGRPYLGSMVAYFPADEPKYSCIVVIRQPRNGYPSGGTMSGGVVKAIAEKVYASHMSFDIRDMEKDSLAVTLPQPKAGERGALEYVLDKLDIEADSDSIETQWVTAKREDGREDVELKDIPIREGLVPNVVGMGAKDAVYLLESVGLRASLNGMGRVSSQSVSPGSRVSKGQTVSLTLK